MVIFRKNYESLSTQNEQVMGEYKDLLQSFQATLKADKVRCSGLCPLPLQRSNNLSVDMSLPTFEFLMLINSDISLKNCKKTAEENM